MDKVILNTITKELTADQITAHNNNYANLANKDIEIYNEIDVKIQESLIDGQVNDNMIGYRIAYDPNNTAISQSITFTGTVTQWLNRISSRVVTAWEAMSSHLSNAILHITSAERSAWNAKFTAVTTGDGTKYLCDNGTYKTNIAGKIPNGVYVGVLDYSSLNLWLPVAITIPASQTTIPKYFFRVASDISVIAGISLNFSCYNGATSSFANANSIMKKPDETVLAALSTGVLYVLTPMLVSGVFKMIVRAVTDSDFITY